MERVAICFTQEMQMRSQGTCAPEKLRNMIALRAKNRCLDIEKGAIDASVKANSERNRKLQQDSDEIDVCAVRECSI